MSTPLRLLAFAVLLLVIGAAGFGLGRLTGPVGPGGGDREPHGALPAAGSTMEGQHP